MKGKILYAKDKKVSKTLKCSVIDVPIYKCKVKILFGEGAKKLEKDWNKKFEGWGGLTRNYLDDGEVLVSFFDKRPKLEHVVHEFHHATDMIMKNIGHKRDPESDEPSAYLMGYLINEYKKLK